MSLLRAGDMQRLPRSGPLQATPEGARGVRRGARFWVAPVCLLGGLALLCFLFAFCEWCRSNDISPARWIWSQVTSPDGGG